MIRKIITIDEEKCNGCALCAEACHEGAIGMRGGKAVLLRDDYCDGLGDCLPVCPTGAIRFEEREAAAYDARAVAQNQQAKAQSACGCPGSAAQTLRPAAPAGNALAPGAARSMLAQWPVQLQLAPVAAPWLDGADLLLAADCTAFACADLHSRLMAGRVTLIGCPKLDQADYTSKLTEIFRNNDIRSVVVARMQVPCCGGLVQAVQAALQASGRGIPLEVVTFSVQGDVLENNA